MNKDIFQQKIANPTKNSWFWAKQREITKNGNKTINYNKQFSVPESISKNYMRNINTKSSNSDASISKKTGYTDNIWIKYRGKMKKWPAAANEWLSAVWVANTQHQKAGVNTLGHRLTALAPVQIRPLSMTRLLRMKGNIMGKYTVYLEHLSTNPPRYCTWQRWAVIWKNSGIAAADRYSGRWPL